MKLILTISMLATAMLISLPTYNTAQAADETSPATSIGPGSLRVTKSTSWWDGLDESIRPAVEDYTGSWLIDLKLYDENDKLVAESEMKSLSNFPARISSTRSPGQYSGGDYSKLEDYQLLVWIVPGELEPCFLEQGHLDWPVPNSDVMVVSEEGHWIESSLPVLNEAQKRELFEQALDIVHEVVLDGLHIYIHSALARRAEISLNWQPREDVQQATDLSTSSASGNRHVADLTVYFPENE